MKKYILFLLFTLIAFLSCTNYYYAYDIEYIQGKVINYTMISDDQIRVEFEGTWFYYSTDTNETNRRGIWVTNVNMFKSEQDFVLFQEHIYSDWSKYPTESYWMNCMNGNGPDIKSQDKTIYYANPNDINLKYIRVGKTNLFYRSKYYRFNGGKKSGYYTVIYRNDGTSICRW